MYKKLIPLLLLVVIFFISSYSKELYNEEMIDKETYYLWLGKYWDKLIKTGENAIKEEVDFYYLRVRLGIAYFEKNNFHKAIYHFEKAYEINAEDFFIKEYLYFAYLYAGRKSEAKNIAFSFTQSQKEKLKIIDKKFCENIKFTYNSSFNEKQSTTKNYSINIDLSENGYQQISKNMTYFNLSLKHQLSQKYSIFHAYTNINKNSFLYTQYDSIPNKNSNSESTLHQYYFSMNSRITRNLNLQFGFHYINLHYIVNSQSISDNDLLGFLSLYKNYNYFSTGGTIYYSKLNSGKQMQGDLLFTLYPFGNLNLYTVSTLSYQIDEDIEKKQTKEFIFDQRFGLKLTKYIWFESFATFGNLHNFSKNNGFLIYNGLDTIKQIYGSRIIISIKSKIQFNIDYSYIKNENSFIPTIQNNNNLNTIKYNRHSITGGISWNF